jgi:DNA-binding transcriptional regulator GbsR (MarR family)
MRGFRRRCIFQTFMTSEALIHRFVEETGSVSQALGLGRVVGQVYACLYLSSEPRTLDDLKDALGISKGSASMAVRQLSQWGAVQQIWVKGDRKDFYRANDSLARMLRSMARDAVGKRFEALGGLLDAAEAELDGRGRNGAGTDEERFILGRVRQLRAFQTKAEDFWNGPLVGMVLRK